MDYNRIMYGGQYGVYCLGYFQELGCFWIYDTDLESTGTDKVLSPDRDGDIEYYHTYESAFIKNIIDNPKLLQKTSELTQEIFSEERYRTWAYEESINRYNAKIIVGFHTKRKDGLYERSYSCGLHPDMYNRFNNRYHDRYRLYWK